MLDLSLEFVSMVGSSCSQASCVGEFVSGEFVSWVCLVGVFVLFATRRVGEFVTGGGLFLVAGVRLIHNVSRW